MATHTRPLGLSYSVCHWDAEYPLGFVGCGVGLLWLWLVLLGQSDCDLGNLVAGCTILLQPGRAHTVTGCAWSAKMLQPATSVRAAFI